jgi:hypothetical protein
MLSLNAGQAGWGIAWYINGTLIPRIMVERGYTYTFVSEGGQEGDGQNFHPFYISDSRRGGRLRKTAAQQAVRLLKYPHSKPHGAHCTLAEMQLRYLPGDDPLPEKTALYLKRRPFT